MSHTWTEHESCARCGDALKGEFAANHLGVRFCHTCYKEAVEVHEHDRHKEPALAQLCHRCHGSLINGYQTNNLGLIFCMTCFDRTHAADGRPLAEWTDREMVPPGRPLRKREDDSDFGQSSHDEDEGFYLHDVFFVTTIFALVMYAMVRFGSTLLTLGGY